MSQFNQISMTPTQLKQELSDAQGQIRAFTHYVTVVQTNGDPSFYARARQGITVQLERLTKELQVLDDTHANGPAIIERTHEKIEKLKTRVLHLKHHVDIAKLREAAERYSQAVADGMPVDEKVEEALSISNALNVSPEEVEQDEIALRALVRDGVEN